MTQVVPAIPTPFYDDGVLDLPAFDAALQVIEPHVDAVFVAGTTGEFLALDDDERIELFRRAVAYLGRDRVIAHVGHGSSRQVLRLAKAATAGGVHRFGLVSPYYIATDDDALVGFYRTVAEAHPDASLYAYLFPERTGTDLSAETFGRLMDLPGMAGAKLSGGAADRLAEYADVMHDEQDLFSGDDARLPQAVGHGAAGLVSAVASAFPESYRALADALDAEDSSAVEEHQAVAAHLVSAVGTTERVKAALAERTGHDWAARMALPALEDEAREEVARAVAEHS
ncbi:dihydrodipicolinate synthase family protein [Georgenia deserti]|uniref:Dihydrodipicolinate synthase family protein n=1 Tax=Georgenia deserti TaxID=2093781 RepID=A0ABW4LA65_9MICO